MNRYWWTLPGPSEFVDRIVRDLRDGVSVVVRMPAHAPAGIDDLIRREVEHDWHTLEVTCDVSPAELLLSRFAPELKAAAKRDVLTVLETRRLRGVAVQITVEACSPAWHAWSEFLADISDRSRSLDGFERTVFCVVVTGEGLLAIPAGNVCLTLHIWRGVVSHLDMALYVARLIRGRPGERIDLEVLGAVATWLAEWDLLLADHLINRSLEDLLEPMTVLREFANRRGWLQPMPVSDDEALWGAGGSDIRDRVGRPHAALLALQNHADAIAARVWGAQVSVLFPLLEEQRRALIARHQNRLTVPFTTFDGRVIRDVRELDLGNICYQLKNNGTRPPRAFMNGLQALVDVRNYLAHFEVVPASLLMDPDLQSYLK